MGIHILEIHLYIETDQKLIMWSHLPNWEAVKCAYESYQWTVSVHRKYSLKGFYSICVCRISCNKNILIYWVMAKSTGQKCVLVRQTRSCHQKFPGWAHLTKPLKQSLWLITAGMQYVLCVNVALSNIFHEIQQFQHILQCMSCRHLQLLYVVYTWCSTTGNILLYSFILDIL